MAEILIGLGFMVGLVVAGNILSRLAGKCQDVIENRIIC